MKAIKQFLKLLFSLTGVDEKVKSQYNYFSLSS